jgi:hypothetical protein
MLAPRVRLELTHPLDAHGNIAAPNKTDCFEIAHFHCRQDVGYFAAEDDDLVAEIQMRHGFQPDAGSQVVKALAYQAERRGRFTVRGRMSWTRRGYTIIAAIIADIASGSACHPHGRAATR